MTHEAINSPDEYAFTSPLPDPILPPLQYPEFIAPNDININDKIMDVYVNHLVNAICQPGDDNNYGSAATKDIECLQALSRRIHYGECWITPNKRISVIEKRVAYH